MSEYLERLAYLYKQYADDNCTPEERNEFMTLVSNDESADELNRLIEKDIDNNQVQRTIPVPRAEELYQLVMQKVITQPNEKTPVRKMFNLRQVAAAIIILVLGAGAYLYFNKVSQKQIAGIKVDQKKINHDIAPGGNRAMLTLADGSQIVLDSAHNGIVTQQGNTKIIKLDDGQLAYNALNEKPTEVVYNTISTPRGGQYEIVLADGSRIWLNAASSLKYPTTFSGKERNVELTGEGYFEITKNAAMPFHVKVSGGMQVEVLGTHFNVNAYDDEPSVKTTLLEGSVRVAGHESTVNLKPGQQAQLKDNALAVINDVDIDNVMSWKTGFFEFENMDLATIMRQVSRWYDVDVVFEGKRSAETFGGRISKDLNLSAILNMLETNGVKFRLEGKNLIVQP